MRPISQDLRRCFERALFLRPNNNIPANDRLYTRHLSNRDDVIRAVKNVYYHKNTLWAHARGGKGLNRATREHPFIEQVDEQLSLVGGQIFNYLNNPTLRTVSRANFDVFHKQLCLTFLSGINGIRARAGIPAMSYGQAQKLINLSFKYLTCYEDYMDYYEYFEQCHMVIDREVLKGLEGNGLTLLFGTTPRQIPHLDKGNYRGHGWTEMNEGEYDELLGEYRNSIDPLLVDIFDDVSYMEIEYNLWPMLDQIR